MQETILCPICKRELGETNLSKHHLIPKSKGGKNGQTVLIHNICHQKIHSLFSEKELKENYNTIEKLRASEEMIAFIKWVSKKAPEFYQKNKKTKRNR